MKQFITLLIGSSVSIFSFGQVATDSKLYKDLKSQDSIFFERGFNRCDMEYLQESISQNLRFYHDQGGVSDRQAFFEATRQNLCANPDKKPIRKVVAESIDVYPLYNDGILYGAVQTGEHKFFIREPGKEDHWTGTAKFTHVWILQNENWLLDDVISYDHKPAPSQENK